MKKSKARARNQAATKTTSRTPPRKTPRAPSKDARLHTRKGEPELETKELISKGTMDLDPRLLQMKSARAIAKSLKLSADASKRLDASPFHSSMSVLSALVSHVEMLRARLEAAKKELRDMYGENHEKSDAGDHTPTPPQEFARKRGAPKGPSAPVADEKPTDNRPRSRPNKVV
ncbi:MAG TPA: DUF3175 domain-containing protein [Candidatus Krumholzibacteria bacterium]|nr:DUF3175 domain-containing protein [Candidatus Krumholzibacteria bacterium]